jgi:hypothetical protein
MVTIVSYALREGKDGKHFVSLQLQGDVELIQSSQTGRFYATARRCFVSSTFNEEAAKALIGTKLPGSIQRTESDPYEYAVPETGEIISLAHSWQYVPEEGRTLQSAPPIRKGEVVV